MSALTPRAFGVVQLLRLLLLATVVLSSLAFTNTGLTVVHRSSVPPPQAVVTSPRRLDTTTVKATLSSVPETRDADEPSSSSPPSSSSRWSLGRREVVVSLSLALMLSTTAVVSSPPVALADEYGRETEAPTLFTGENVMICTKRGPLGACLKTEVRTAENDNDKASKYMKSQDGDVKRKDEAMRAAAVDQEGGGSELLTRLRRQTEENRERNERLVMQKTIENNQAASFGPFDRQTVILNADGKGYTLLENPQAMRLKKAGYIKDRQFVTQPTAEVMNEALEPSPEESSGFIGGVIKGVFGGGGD